MKILFACRKFDGVIGGSEYMAATLMNALQARGHDVSLITWDINPDAKSFYNIHDSIVWHKIGMGHPSKKAGPALIAKRALKVRALLKAARPDVALCFQEGSYVTLKAYALGLHIPMICTIRESPFRYKHVKPHPPFWFSCFALKLSATITVQFSRYRDAFPAYLQDKICVTPNQVLPPHGQAQPQGEPGKRKALLSVGRLGYDKNFECLIQSFILAAPNCPDWDLTIVGGGERREKLQAIIDAAPGNIGARIKLAGPSSDIPSWLVTAHLFCLTSHWEGFPNAMAEAMAHGLPCAGFEECDGVRDLIEDGKTGRLAAGNGDPAALAITLTELMQDDIARATYGAAAHERMKQYAPEKIVDIWEDILSEAVKP